MKIKITINYYRIKTIINTYKYLKDFIYYYII